MNSKLESKPELEPKSQTWDALNAIGTIVSALILLVSAVYAYQAIRVSEKSDRINLLGDLQKRYDSLRYDEREKINEDYLANKDPRAIQIKANDYYYRFWDLISEEFSDWKQGIIEPDIFSDWMRFRQREWGNNADTNSWVAGISYQQGWASAV